MKKISLLLITFLLSINALAAPMIVPKAPSIAAKGYLLIDFDSGKVLSENNSEETLEPASLTKMMTSYIIGQELKSGNLKLTDKVTISNNAWSKNFPDSSKMFIEVGKEVTVEDLNRGIIIQSGNDACVAMAEHIAGSESAFADLMNSWAAQLGMNDTHFVNSHGLHADGHHTTAKDMAILAKAIITDVPNEYKIYSEKSFKYNGIVQYNRNGLLWDKSLNVDGMKTGHTSAAGYSLVSSATKDGMRLISVVMGTRSDEARKVESKKLLNWGFRFFETITPYKANDQLANERIWMGTQANIRLGVPVDTPLTLPRNQSQNLKADFVIDNELRAPIQKGDKVGQVNYTLADEAVASYDLIALETVEEGGIFSRIIDYIKLLFIGWFG
ncbi:D-alanyl-D-alanine carboxypeptidase family protein [Psychromonas sp. 14N.309.X.WAT.B.A12]|jgi:serine-type D-Ala-D-Ala carboxypeptidase (penicillin-binding protein 5/6)|uniref:D-alanyl-D-alanine carboxypeptidase family protein n=1 Tax=unclassified Psychromonas TaxID=2614957 RepID=UPI0025B1F991|nr:D-alanyl-D-alanine carboxypeptidase family protein [Psychromonas sp. 14N.309.X.WAT.B.A12]MDN2662829.1 D-alanyl-D-alanine carboxypeptidase [Psychromonas sp. 14N.309.X.WAT.B.A12]